MASRPKGYGLTAEVNEKLNSKYSIDLGRFFFDTVMEK